MKVNDIHEIAQVNTAEKIFFIKDYPPGDLLSIEELKNRIGVRQ